MVTAIASAGSTIQDSSGSIETRESPLESLGEEIDEAFKAGVSVVKIGERITCMVPYPADTLL